MKFFSKSALYRATSLESAAIAVAMLGVASVATPAFAQDAAPQASQTAECADENANGVCDSEEGGQIVVTGSRIARPTLSSPVPLTSVSVGELTETGDVSLGDALNDLPSLRSTFSAGNSSRFIGTAGLNILDLRGLGTPRTLVLVNGKRHITASPGDYLVDVNTIPVDLLERVDIVTGGNSAVYGSDAVAGVVNFVLKRNYEGLAFRGQGAISSRGDRGNYFVSGTWGKNFADGRGNIAIAAEYAKAEPLFFYQRDDITGALTGRCQFQVVEPTGGEPGGTDGIYDNAFVCGVRNAAISDAGTIGALDPSTSPTRRYLRFANDGTLYADTPTLSYAPVGSGNQIGGNGSTLRNTGVMAAGTQRFAFNLLAHYDISDAFRPYVEAKYVHVDAFGEGQPSFFQGSIPGFFGGGAELSCSNGFLSAQNLTQLQATGRCLSPTGVFTMSRFNVDFGGRSEDHNRKTFRIVGGIEGTFNDDWNYEVSVNYGRFEADVAAKNNLLLFDLAGNDDGFLLATQAVVAPAGFSGSNFATNSSGQRVICAINATTNVRPDCVPVNLFGFGKSSQAALDFIHSDGIRTERAESLNFLASVSGDSSQLFELPGGPIGFVLGGEYREDTASSVWDDFTASGSTFLNALAPFTPPKVTVKEAFGELDVPLLKDMPFAKELSVRGAARVSDYNTRAGTVWAWNVDGIWAPIEDIRFRAAYAVSVRAPTQSDLFAAGSQNFAFIADPCDSNNITGNPNRAANCAAAGVPTVHNAASAAACATTAFNGAVGSPWRNCTALTSSTPFLSGGNPTLNSEKGKSLTLGVVIEPRFIPGLNLTIDYYRIKVENVISALGAQQIVNLCYDTAGGISNPYCATVNRNASTGLFVDPAVIAGGINFAALKADGIDIDLSYRKTFDNGHRLSLRGIATRVLKRENFTNPLFPQEPNRIKDELGDPSWAANFNINYDFGPVDVSYNLRYIGKQTIGTWEAQNPYQGICPTSGSTGYTGRTCTPNTLTTLDPQNLDQFPQVYYPGVIYHNARVNFETADKKYSFYMGVDNFTDRKPPLGLLGTAGGDPYETFGRFFYAGFRANF
ncbi:TonB-dependent receptor domain-containing protein [Novosphingobium ginsenosidimutans]|uniref:TonB-dependent receptor n=1 Tax=Novosphingobium ginsenosidimutans TaxID=1176536 RepID=A0A5B8S072_9SPHN|nr:TonB-dependent receptor [Novosphingobium ginsenosidimutans]QEA14951.1 TonB-dependent receptor [Novosphingobium ginsenosidimutans]